MTTTSKTLSIIAFYLSEYDMDAVHALGYKTRSEAMKSISIAAGRDNNYLKLRRDEFDALPESKSTRNGWKNRPPLKEVAKMGAHLRTFSFEELTDIVKTLIAGFDSSTAIAPTTIRSVDVENLTEEELEDIINFSDPNAAVEVVTKTMTKRVCNTSIIHRLKKLYKGQCQLCGKRPLADFDLDICEAHHIEFFAETQNNDASNIIIVCPNHHRLLHKIKLTFLRDEMRFVGKNNELKVELDYHLKQ